MLSDSIEIKTTPERIFDFFLNLPENYTKWHPDHITATWVEKNPAIKGSIIYVEEYLHGEPHKLKSRWTNVETNKRLDYKHLFPISLFFPGGSFIITDKGDHCIFTATMAVRFERILSKIVKKRKILLEEHMKEEGRNLKKLLEN